MPETKRPLKVFLCHASLDKLKVRELYRYLRRRGIRPWFDEMDLVGGQDWQVEIPKALATSDAIIICLTKNSVDKEGYIQREIKFALDKALEMPEGRIFLIPVRFEECEVPFSLSRYQWVDLFDEAGYARMMRALKFRASQLERATVELPEKDIEEEKLALDKANREKQERDAAEKEKRERAERRAAQIADLKETFSKSFNTFRSAIAKAMPILRIGGIIGIILILLWVGSWAMPQILSLVPTAEPSSTITPTKPPTPTRTLTLTPTETKTPIPTLTPVPQSSMLFQEDFEDIQVDWGEPLGDWVIEQEPNGNHYWSASGPSDYPQNFYLDESTLNWTDYAFESRIQFVKGKVLWICFRADVGDNWYAAVLDNNYPIINYFQGNPANVEGKLTSFHSSPREPFAYNKWYTIRIEVKGNNLKTYVDNVLDVDLTLPSPLIKTQGGIGYFMDGGSEFNIDDIRVWSLK